MSFRKEDGVSSLCQKALHIITELCFAGQVEWDKCSGIFPADRAGQGGGGTGKGFGAACLAGASQSRRAAGDLLAWFVACTCWVSAPTRLSRPSTCYPGAPGTWCPGLSRGSQLDHPAWRENLCLASRNQAACVWL